jgi:hypothetical protein
MRKFIFDNKAGISLADVMTTAMPMNQAVFFMVLFSTQTICSDNVLIIY